MLVPVTFTETQVLVIFPCDHPVVRPTLLAVFPTTPPPSEPMANDPAIVTELVFTPVVFSIRPRVKLTPVAYLAREASLKRHFLPAGHPGSPLT